MDAKLVQKFARENSELARKALKPPPPPPPSPLMFRNPENVDNQVPMEHVHSHNSRKYTSLSPHQNFEDYLKWRGWDSEYIENSMTRVLLSHALTFPLTLASRACHFLLPSSIVTNTAKTFKSSHHIHLCCVGPRAEANLPDEYWREFLIASTYLFIPPMLLQDSSLNQSRPCHNLLPKIHWTIDFIGPEVMVASTTSTRTHTHGADNAGRRHGSRCIYLFDDDGDKVMVDDENGDSGNDKEEKDGANSNEKYVNEKRGSRIILNFHRKFLHHHVLDLYNQTRVSVTSNSTEHVLNHWDGFVLFNPGIAHPHLEKSWKPTLEFIMKTRKNILITAHSNLDKDRDQNLLRRLMWMNLPGRDNVGREVVEYCVNPFASKMSFEDPFPTDGKDTRVRPNHSVCSITNNYTS